MKRLVLLLWLAACGSPAQTTVAAPTAAHAASSASTASDRVSALSAPDGGAEAMAMTFGAAIGACDVQAALDDSVSYDEVVAVTHKDVDRAEYEDELRSFVEGLCREFREAHGRVVGARAVKSEVHRQSEDPERLKQDVEITWVQYTVEHEGRREERGAPFMFMRTPRGWRFLVKH